MTQPEKRLYRSRSNRVVAGVCGGLAEYFGLDATLVRLGFVLGIIFGLGSLLVVYLVMLFVVPEEPLSAAPVPPPAPPSEQQ
jgi:phage shock protein PspC (stress-responsive transcriptional regulator)